ncbi:hypothetical protein DL546_008613 [Coniochaeta pulveracea]|uniref:ubiquitinyl hydrolase 1 n=1 Tax=Coniochaeta pulveracea TaxID=177199 RepID=A0A420YNL5_9PEZI|nr:hypothetical protein DL546_008613 [Coniochaeta pulveracea]
MEIEGGILVRKVQADIGAQMLNPAGGHNAVMQLNMGEGKSSVIIPMIAAVSADGSILVRVVVGKAQSKQMLEILISMVGGLCNRRIYHMPFTRSLKLGTSEAETIYATYKSCMENGGILLVQPEQILSFQLMGIETNLSGRTQVSQCLLKAQHFFHHYSRDIVDESDENFSVKFELVYTMGTQRSIDFSPQRWSLIQDVLRTIRRLAPQIMQELPQSLEIEPGPVGSFPRTRILREDAQGLLCQRLAEEICASGVPGFPIARQPTSMKKAVLEYITTADLDSTAISWVESTFFTESTKDPLLLLRGLIAGGVIGFALGHKRWRVNYGLDDARQPPTKLAVPYRAKDSPALRSEFSHPDVVIILTCLSHYYGGLCDADLFTALEQVLKSDQAEDEYQAWVRDAPTLPAAFRTLSGINPKDRLQCTQHVFPHLRQAQAAVNFFLSRVVLPKEMKEFPHKLSASGWDLGQLKAHPTTGFSGTNDSRHLLPLSVKHTDLPDQKHTNALVLKHLLQPENSVCLMSASTEPQLSDAERLLQLVMDLPQPAQVILDVGAQILELSNVQVAEAWLAKARAQLKKEAVVFFDDNDELCVLTTNGVTETFQTSPYAKQLDRCLVFLDEAHTRGTDLKLPEDYRAVVTLGANLTKDRLVQACMRMRKLGKGQSVVFCVSNEIQTKVRAICEKGAEHPLEVSDVLIWSIHETYADLRKSMPLWATQGVRFERQDTIWQEARTETAISLTGDQAGRFLEKEALCLEDRYRPRPASAVPDAFANLQSSSSLLNEIWERCQLFDSTQFSSATLQEEQERELSPEIEAERQIERPRQAEPMPHELHPHVLSFVDTGKIPSNSPAFMKAFLAFERTTAAAAHFRVQDFPGDLLATRDFIQTVQLTGKGSYSDDYQRPVQWILTTSEGCRMVVISPYEATRLRQAVAKSSAVFMHTYAPRPNLAFEPLDDLRLFTIPPLPDAWKASSALVLQLNLFAGQLYFSSAKEYRDFCDFLCLAWRHMDGEDAKEGGDKVLADGFIVPQPGRTQAFQVSPTKFLQVIITKMRRNGEGIDKTHYGRVLEGELLTDEDFVETAGAAGE